MALHVPAMTTIQSPHSVKQGKSSNGDGFARHDAAPLTSTKKPSRESSPRPVREPGSTTEHVIQLSSIDHCMPRAYIRVCLAFRLPSSGAAQQALAGLELFLRNIVRTAPFLAGYVDPAHEADGSIGRVEIHYSEEDVRAFPAVQTRQFTDDEMPWTYSQLDEARLPPSAIRPDLISALPENTDDGRAPVFRVQANFLEGGLIVSIYLHHCVTDGSGLGLLVSGGTINKHPSPDGVNGTDNFLKANGTLMSLSSETDNLSAIAAQENKARRQLSTVMNFDTRRELSHKGNVRYDALTSIAASHAGRGCIFVFPRDKLDALRLEASSALSMNRPSQGDDDNNGIGEPDCLMPFLTEHDTLQAFLWHHLTQARTPSLSPLSRVKKSTLLIPVDIRKRMLPPLPSSYFGSAVDFARVVQPVSHLASPQLAALARTAQSIRSAVEAVQDLYVRAAINLSNTPGIDVRDLLASNMNRITGADMYITSWLNLPLYDKGDLGMGLGQPDWVRKPWSKDPGACIILPQDPRKDVVEVVVQLTDPDMERLLHDGEFMAFVEKVIDE